MASVDDPEALIRRFAAGVAHELNNALTAVLGIADMVARDDAVDALVREQVRAVAEHARTIAALSRRLSSFSRAAAPAKDLRSDIQAVLQKPLPNLDARIDAAVPGSGPRSGDTVLLVEDEEVVRAILTWQLEGMGYRVAAAASAGEALVKHAAESSRVVAAVLDLVLPDFDGAELCRRLRLSDADLPVVMLTGAVPREATPSHSLVWMTKPVALGDLQAALRRVTGGSR